MQPKPLVLLVSFALLLIPQATSQQRPVFHRGSKQNTAMFTKHENTVLDVRPSTSENAEDSMSCAFKCLDNGQCVSYNMAASPDSNHNYECQLLPTDKYNSSDNLKSSRGFHHYSIKSPCESWPCKNGGTCVPLYRKERYRCVCAPGFKGTHCVRSHWESCNEALKSGVQSDGLLSLRANGTPFTAYCHMATRNQAWTLIARFSNADAKNWMEDDGAYWYDRTSAVGQTTDPAHNTDMISPAFWFVSGTQFKITRSDDPSHTALLQTTGNCLGGHTFRSKITSYGNFRYGAVWASDQCLGSCNVQYGGLCNSTEGFEQHSCDGGIQSRNKIGFWCDVATGDGAVLMIGGGGSTCARADHGIAITETNAASFVDLSDKEYDFGGDANNVPTSSYSLNIWIR